jgi:Ca2+-binding EF-hand superfamily protein
MDTNGNGSLDPEEVQGPARFMLERMARNNPKIDMSKPIPISVLTESMQQMRGGGGGPWGGPGMEEDTVEINNETLVPGFGVKMERIAVPGFGSSGSVASIKVEERDLREADERLRRYDKNNDGSLDENEIKEARWSDSLSQWDRNRDGKLVRAELAARYARKREQRSDQEAKKGGNNENQKGQSQQANSDAKTPSRPFEKIASYRVGEADRSVPEWFVNDDSNKDKQVSMNEFGRKWDSSTLEDFYKFDSNQDGFITLKECQAAVKKGYLKGSGSAASSKSDSRSKELADSSSKDADRKSGESSGGAEPSMVDWSKKRITKLDKDKNGFLTPDEFSDTKAKFGDVDKDGNGQVSVEEYAVFRQNIK